MFSTQKNSGVYKASTAQVDYNVQVVVPVYLNNKCINALRVNGNSAITLVDSRLVESHQIVSGETIQLRRAFDDNSVKKPVAVVHLRLPHFACNKNIRVKVAVTALPDNLQYTGLDWPLCHCAMAQAPPSTNVGAPWPLRNFWTCALWRKILLSLWPFAYAPGRDDY